MDLKEKFERALATIPRPKVFSSDFFEKIVIASPEYYEFQKDDPIPQKWLRPGVSGKFGTSVLVKDEQYLLNIIALEGGSYFHIEGAFDNINQFIRSIVLFGCVPSGTDLTTPISAESALIEEENEIEELIQKGQGWSNCGWQEDDYEEAQSLMGKLTNALVALTRSKKPDENLQSLDLYDEANLPNDHISPSGYIKRISLGAGHNSPLYGDNRDDPWYGNPAREGMMPDSEPESRIRKILDDNKEVFEKVRSTYMTQKLLSVSSHPVKFKYTNYRGETSIREVLILGLRWGATEWHPEPGMLLEAFDLDKNETREFALKDCDFTTTE